MITFEFLPGKENETEISCLSQGHIIVSDGRSACSSKTTNQPMMLVLSVTELVGGLCSLVADRNGRQYSFRSVDASFGLKFIRKDNDLVIYCGSKALTEASTIRTTCEELIASVWIALLSFQTYYQPVYIVDATNENDLVINGWEKDIDMGFQKTLDRWSQAFPRNNYI